MKKSIVFVICLICVSFFVSSPVQASSFQDGVVTNTKFVWKSFEEADVEKVETDDNKVSGVTIEQDYCSDPNFIKPFIFLGKIFTIVKILVPILIIVFGMIDFFKAVIASKDDEIKKSIRSLLFRAIAGLVIFFIPTIVHLVFLLIDDWKKYETSYSKCSLCISSPSKCKNNVTSND